MVETRRLLLGVPELADAEALSETITGHVIGCVGFYHPQRPWPGVDLGWVFQRSRWGHGFATKIGQRFERADVDPVHGEPVHVYTIART